MKAEFVLVFDGATPELTVVGTAVASMSRAALLARRCPDPQTVEMVAEYRDHPPSTESECLQALAVLVGLDLAGAIAPLVPPRACADLVRELRNSAIRAVAADVGGDHAAP
jgi:hypothetical protein